MIPVSFLGGWGTQCPPGGKPRNHKRRDIGEVMNRVAYEGNGMSRITRYKFRCYQNPGSDNGYAQNAGRGPTQAMIMGVPVRGTTMGVMAVKMHPLNSTRNAGLEERRSARHFLLLMSYVHDCNLFDTLG